MYHFQQHVILVNSAVSKTFLQQQSQKGYVLLKEIVNEVTESNYNLKFITEEEVDADEGVDHYGDIALEEYNGAY